MSDGFTRLLPGFGSFSLYDHIWSLDTSGKVILDGIPVPGAGGRTSALELYNFAVYAQDAVTGLWYEWDNKSLFVGPVIAPP